MKRLVILIMVMAIVLMSVTAFAVPQLINYQGRLTDDAGTPVNNTLAFIFTMYNAPSAGSVLWSETQNVSINNGVYNVLLGSVTPIPASAFDGDGVYLGINVDSDGEMTPRQRIASVGYSYRAGSVDTGGVTANAIADGTITAIKLAPGVETLDSLSCSTDQVAKWNGSQWVCTTPAVCFDGAFLSCYTGPAGTMGLGECLEGTSTCSSGLWDPCLGETLPALDLTTDGLDQDCDAADFYLVWSDTGQIGNYTATFGEDSDFVLFGPHSFTDQGDGTVVDNNAGLMWQQQDDNTLYNWYQAVGSTEATYNPGGAINVCGNLSLADYSDWRLPSRKELVVLVNSGSYNPAIDAAKFPGTDSSGYWTDERANDSLTEFFAVDFINGSAAGSANANTNLVRCVRGNSITAFTHSNLGGGIARDDRTLNDYWQQQDDNTPMTWEQALAYCSALSINSYDEFRLPSRNELETLVIPLAGGYWIDTVVFAGNNFTHYWTSTTDAGNSSAAWAVNFADGSIVSLDKTSNVLVRCTTN